jgi:hypothetical protein
VDDQARLAEVEKSGGVVKGTESAHQIIEISPSNNQMKFAIEDG